MAAHLNNQSFILINKERTMSKKRLLTPSWLFWLNFIVLQWFFTRLAYVFDDNSNYIGKKLIFRLPLTGWQLFINKEKKYVKEV